MQRPLHSFAWRYKIAPPQIKTNLCLSFHKPLDHVLSHLSHKTHFSIAPSVRSIFATIKHQTSTYTESEEYFFIKLGICYLITEHIITFKIKFLREDHIVNVDIPIRHALVEGALWKQVDVKLTNTRLKKE
jgi:hypothetical protein